MPHRWKDLPRYWILDENHIPVPTDDIAVWGRWHADMANRRVAFTEVVPGVTVSTVALGIDHSMTLGEGEPVLFESMAFSDDVGGMSGFEEQRYTTWAEAQLGHNRMVEMIRARLREKNAVAMAEDIAQATGMEAHLVRRD